jgi:hypothetical protein
MAAKELAIQRLGGKFWRRDFFGIASRRTAEEIRVKKLVVQEEAGIMNQRIPKICR